MRSVARPDDGVHRFFTARAKRIAPALMEPEFLSELRTFFAPGHRERRFALPTMLWLGMFGAANAVMRSMESILDAACGGGGSGSLGTVPVRPRGSTGCG